MIKLLSIRSLLSAILLFFISSATFAATECTVDENTQFINCYYVEDPSTIIQQCLVFDPLPGCIFTEWGKDNNGCPVPTETQCFETPTPSPTPTISPITVSELISSLERLQCWDTNNYELNMHQEMQNIYNCGDFYRMTPPTGLADAPDSLFDLTGKHIASCGGFIPYEEYQNQDIRCSQSCSSYPVAHACSTILPTTPPTPSVQICPANYDPACGINNFGYEVTYSNNCELEKDNSEFLHWGTCHTEPVYVSDLSVTHDYFDQSRYSGDKVVMNIQFSDNETHEFGYIIQDTETLNSQYYNNDRNSAYNYLYFDFNLSTGETRRTPPENYAFFVPNREYKITITDIDGAPTELDHYFTFPDTINLETGRFRSTEIYEYAIPNSCSTWYDGCNTCGVENGDLTYCTQRACFQYEQPYCMEYQDNVFISNWEVSPYLITLEVADEYLSSTEKYFGQCVDIHSDTWWDSPYQEVHQPLNNYSNTIPLEIAVNPNTEYRCYAAIKDSSGAINRHSDDLYLYTPAFYTPTPSPTYTGCPWPTLGPVPQGCYRERVGEMNPFGTCPSPQYDIICDNTPPAGYEEEVLTNENNPFDDTSAGTLEAEAAAFLYWNAIIGGFPDGEFKGSRYVNRAEASKFITRILYSDVGNNTSSSSFWDVKSGEWYVPYVEKAAQIGIIQGHPDGSFRPANTINTAEFLAILSRLDINIPNTGESYIDVSSSDWFYNGAVIAEAYNLFPYRTTYLSPEALVTRDEMAVAIYQLLQNQLKLSLQNRQ